MVVALGGESLAAEERGVAKPRGRGLGQRNIKIAIFLDNHSTVTDFARLRGLSMLRFSFRAA